MQIIFIDGECSYDEQTSNLIIQVFELIRNVLEDLPDQSIHLEINELITKTLFDETLHNILTLKPSNEQISEYLLADKDSIFKSPICLLYAINNGIKVNNIMLENIVKNKSPKCVQCVKVMEDNGYKLPITSCNVAVIYENVEFLKYVHENGCMWNEEICRMAADFGQLECLKYAHENGCLWNISTCRNAASSGQLECLKYAHENGCGWNENICSIAACYGRLECLRYAHENGCPWDKFTCVYAANSGHLECLKYAHENGCKWDDFICKYAAENGYLECLKYAHENGCPYDKTDLLKCSNKSCVEYIKKFMRIYL